MSKRLQIYPLGPTYGGLNTALAPHVLDNGVSPEMDGYVMRTKGAEAAKGWEKMFAQHLTDGAAVSTSLKVLKIDQFFKRDGSSYLVVLTNKRAYYYNETLDQYTPITPGAKAYTTIDQTSTSGTTTLYVASTSGYTIGDTIIITDPGGTETEENVVNSINAGVSLGLLSNLLYTHTVPGEEDPVTRTYASAIVDADSASGQKVLNVSHTNQFTAGEAIIVGLGTARQEYGIIDTIQAGISLTLTANLTNSHTAVQADKVYRLAGLNFTQDATEFDTETDEDFFYWTDGVNPIQRWDATGAPTYSANLPGLTATDAGVWPSVDGIGTISSAVRAKYIRAFEGFLVLGHTTEQGNTAPQRVRWSRYGSATSWANNADGTGQAGYFTFAGPDFIVRLQQLKRELVVYRERNIEGMSYMGYPDIFAFRRVETGVGLIGHDALTDLGDMHLILGPDDAYAVDGMSAPGIGGDVKESIFDEMNPAYKDACKVFYIEEESEALFIIPTGSDSVGTKAYVYSTLFKKWVGTRPLDGMSFGYYELQATATWDSSTGTWVDKDSAWDSRVSLAAAPLNLMGGDDGYIYLLDSIATKDGVAWDRTYLSKLTDCGDPTTSKRCLHVRIGVRQEGSETITVYLGKAHNEGDQVDWSDPQTISLAGDNNGYAYFDDYAKLFQVKIVATGLNNIREIELGYVGRTDID